MKTHRRYRRQRPEYPNIIVVTPEDIEQALGSYTDAGKYGENIQQPYGQSAIERLAATSEIKRHRLMAGTWVDEPCKRYILNGFDQYGNPVSETVTVPTLQHSDEPLEEPDRLLVDDEGRFLRIINTDEPYKAPEQLPGTNLIPRQPGPETTVENWHALYEILPSGQVVSKPTLEYIDEIAPFDEADIERLKRAFGVSPAEIGDVQP